MKTPIQTFFRPNSIRPVQMTRVPVSTLMVAMVASALVSFVPNARAAEPQPAAPAWTLKDVEGKTVQSSDFKGKVVILDFWATWCPPCKKEIPDFIELQKKYGEKGLVIVGVSLDEQGPSVVKPFITQLGISYPIVMGDEKIVQDFGGVEGIPTTFIIDREGKIVGRHVAFTPLETFEKEIAPLL